MKIMYAPTQLYHKNKEEEIWLEVTLSFMYDLLTRETNGHIPITKCKGKNKYLQFFG